MRRAYLIGFATGLVGIAAMLGVGFRSGTAAAGAPGDNEGSVTGPQADAAGGAALDIVGGGTVAEVDTESEHGARWEVEVTKSDGSTVEVLLNDSLGLVLTQDENDQGGNDNDAAEVEQQGGQDKGGVDNDTAEVEEQGGHEDEDGQQAPQQQQP